MNYKEFAEIIKTKRIELGLTQKEMALSIPIPISRYNRIENGKLEPTFLELSNIVVILNIDLNQIKEKKPVEHMQYD